MITAWRGVSCAQPREIRAPRPPSNAISVIDLPPLPLSIVDDRDGAVSDIDPATARWLTSPAGLDEVADVTSDLDAGDTSLRIGQRLRDGGHPPDRASAVLAAATARRRARGRWPDADALLFTREGLEQASDPEVSAWRARRFVDHDRTVLDLCAGVGGDALALAEAGLRVIAVDEDPGRLLLLEHNARVRGVEIESRLGDVLDVDARAAWWIHADPGRRRGTRRVRTLREHLPSVPALLDRFGGAPGVGIVLSPAVDLEDPDLPEGELEFVQLGGDLIEAIVWLGEGRRGGAVASSTLLPGGEHLTRRSVAEVLPIGPIGSFLVEVAPAAVRARLHDEVGAHIDARRVARNRALLTVEHPPPPSAWYRSRSIETVLPAHPRSVRRWLKDAPEYPLEIVLHGIDTSVERWWRELGRPQRGPEGRRLELIRTDEGALAIVTVPAG